MVFLMLERKRCAGESDDCMQAWHKAERVSKQVSEGMRECALESALSEESSEELS